MPINEQYNNLFHPLEDDKTVWRFLTLPKFLDLLCRKKLFFCQVYKLRIDDPCEGINNLAYSNKVKSAFNQLPQIIDIDKFSVKGWNQFKEINHDYWSYQCYVSCWHLGENEPGGFWKLYSDQEFGIAIESQVKFLKRSLKLEKRILSLGKVFYIDYEKMQTPLSPAQVMFCKRKCFSFENEIRILWVKKNENQNIKKDPQFFKNSPIGVHMDINLKVAIKNVWLSPASPPWFEELVGNILKQYSLSPRLIKKSDVFLPPKYLS